jgi:hypothetical protein
MGVCVSMFQRNRLIPPWLNLAAKPKHSQWGLSDPWHRRFAYRYLGYLQDVANGADPTKTFAERPSCRLICTELERLFKAHLYRPETTLAACT